MTGKAATMSLASFYSASRSFRDSSELLTIMQFCLNAFQPLKRKHKRDRPTDAHSHQEPRNKFSKIYDRIAATLGREIIWICASAADPVRDWGEHVGCDDEEWVVFVP